MAARAPEVRDPGDRRRAALGRGDLRRVALGRRLLPPPARRRAVRRHAEDAARRRRGLARGDRLANLGRRPRGDRRRCATRQPPAGARCAARRKRRGAACDYGRGSRSCGARARRARLDRIICAARATTARRRRAARAGADGRPGPGGGSDRRLARAIRRLPPARRHRQRQDGGVPEPHRAGARGGPRRAGAGPGDRADAAARRALPRAPLRPGRRPAFLACGRRTARGLARGERWQRAGRDRHALGRVHADAADSGWWSSTRSTTLPTSSRKASATRAATWR